MRSPQARLKSTRAARRGVFALLVALILLFAPGQILTSDTQAQTSAVVPSEPPEIVLDDLPDCNFTAESGLSNVMVGAVVVNFETGVGCVENLDQTFQVASVPKLFIAGAYFEALINGTVSTATRLTFTRDYWMGGRTDCLRAEDIGQNYSTRSLVELMIYCSDNAATWMVMDSLGWERVQAYIDRLGIPDIGPVIPYSDVDRQKLAFMDARWDQVPRGLASRFYRARLTDGLVPTYFAEVPEYTSDQRIAANIQYMQTADTNTATPRAMAEYLMQLRADRAAMQGNDALVASLVFNTMLKTQREHSAQAFPGTVLIGAKNGFDVGLTAEVNLVFDRVGGLLPEAMFIIFTQQPDLTRFDVQFPNQYFGTLNTYLRRMSSRFFEMLYGDTEMAIPPVIPNPHVALIRYQSESTINDCWRPYRRSGFDPAQVNSLQSCLALTVPYESAPVGEMMGVAVILRALSGAENKIVLAFTAPDGTPYSYQTDADFKSQVGVYWLHPIEQAGEWRLDVYLNLQRIHSSTFRAE